MMIAKGFVPSLLIGAAFIRSGQTAETLRIASFSKIYAIEGVSTGTEPSDRHVAGLIDDIKNQRVKAIFLENTLNPKVSREITRETTAKIGGSLYADGLGNGDGSAYEGLDRHNISTIVNALK